MKQLKNNPELYLSMIDNGLKRPQEFTEEIITEYYNLIHNYLTSF
ncbi:hypothetical protein [Limnofasciculus baicalensis]|nr:hypothetical protein [Limnofasciculus baicalensis]